MATQHGVIRRTQAVAGGMTDRQIRWRVSSGRWWSVHPGVYAKTGAPLSWHGRALAACLWGGSDAVASHRTAAALHRLQGCPQGVIEISTDRRLRSQRVIVHQAEPTASGGGVKIDHIRVTSPSRTIVDLAGLVGFEAIEIAVDDALRRRLTTHARLSARIDGARRGVPGAAVLRRVLEARDPARAVPESPLEARDPARAVPESPLESRLLRLVRRSRLPSPVCQYEVREQARLIARVDLAYPDKLIAIEADSRRHHSGERDWNRDLARRNELSRRGWIVVHVTWDDIRHRPEQVIAWLEDALKLRIQSFLRPDTTLNVT